MGQRQHRGPPPCKGRGYGGGGPARPTGGRRGWAPAAATHPPPSGRQTGGGGRQCATTVAAGPIPLAWPRPASATRSRRSRLPRRARPLVEPLPGAPRLVPRLEGAATATAAKLMGCVADRGAAGREGDGGGGRGGGLAAFVLSDVQRGEAMEQLLHVRRLVGSSLSRPPPRLSSPRPQHASLVTLTLPPQPRHPQSSPCQNVAPAFVSVPCRPAALRLHPQPIFLAARRRRGPSHVPGFFLHGLPPCGLWTPWA